MRRGGPGVGPPYFFWTGRRYGPSASGVAGYQEIPQEFVHVARTCVTLPVTGSIR
jgi:hypothetical protein